MPAESVNLGIDNEMLKKLGCEYEYVIIYVE